MSRKPASKRRRGRSAWPSSRTRAPRARCPRPRGCWKPDARLDREGRPSRRPPVLVREGFSWGAFLFGPFWLLANRLWLAALLWLVAAVAALLLASVGGAWALPALQFLLGCHARDLKRRALAR